MPRLKVFRTTSGIHDHIVAAPSRPAALKAWGARTDLFSMGVASEVTDAKVREKALKQPGKVISISRTGGKEKTHNAKPKPPKRRMPKPSRKKLDAAEQKLDQLATRQNSEIMALDREMQSLQRRRDALEQRHAKARSEAEDKVDAERADYEATLEGWDPAN